MRALLLAVTGILASGCHESAPPDLSYGFRVWFTSPGDVEDPEPEPVECDLPDLPIEWRWVEGPHHGFGAIAPAALARD
jgi:hypothetical protein